LLIIGSHLSLAFEFLSRTCHPTKQTFKSLNINQSKEKTKKAWISPTIAIATTT
jgi:hypothetical protein